MSAIAKNTFNIQSTGIGSLPVLSDQEIFQILDQVDVPFYPEFPQLPGHMMLDYPIGSSHVERSKMFELFCRYLSQKNAPTCKLQWCGLVTFAQYRKNIEQYLDYFKTLLNWIDEIKSKVPSIKKIILFIDEPALSLSSQSSISLQQWARYDEILQMMDVDFYIHCCGLLPKEWPVIYREFGLSFDLNVVDIQDPYLAQFSKLVLGIQKQSRQNIPEGILARTRMVTPPCGLTSSNYSQVIEILSKLRQF